MCWLCAFYFVHQWCVLEFHPHICCAIDRGYMWDGWLSESVLKQLWLRICFFPNWHEWLRHNLIGEIAVWGQFLIQEFTLPFHTHRQNVRNCDGVETFLKKLCRKASLLHKSRSTLRASWGPAEGWSCLGSFRIHLPELWMHLSNPEVSSNVSKSALSFHLVKLILTNSASQLLALVFLWNA